MKIKKNFVKRKVGDKYLVVDVSGRQDFNMFIELNETSSDIWDALQKGKTAAEIAAMLAGKYDVSPAKARQDVEKMIAAMEAEGLFE